MSQKTATDLRELKELIQGLDKKIDLGFSEIKLELSEIKGELRVVNTRLTLVENGLLKLDSRLWGVIWLLPSR